MSDLSWNQPDADDVRYWQALYDAVNSRNELVQAASYAAYFKSERSKVYPDGFHLRRGDVDRVQADFGHDFFLDPYRQVEYFDQTEGGRPNTSGRDIYGTVPQWYKLLTKAGESSTSHVDNSWEYNKSLVVDYPNFFVSRHSGTVPVNFNLFLKDAAGICREMRYVPFAHLPHNNFKEQRREIYVTRWDSDTGDLTVRLGNSTMTETLTGFGSQGQVVDWMKAQWQDAANSRFVTVMETEVGIPIGLSISGSFFTGGSAWQGPTNFRAACTYYEYKANGWPWDVPLTMYCVNAPAAFNLNSPYNPFDYARSMSGTLLPKYPDDPSLSDYVYLSSTVSVIPIGNLSSDFTLGATFPFPATLPAVSYTAGFAVYYPMFTADLDAAVIHLE